MSAVTVLAVLAALAALAARSTDASATRSIAVTPSPASTRQLGPPSPTPAPTTASSSSEERRYPDHVEVDEDQQLTQQPVGFMQTITTQVRLFLACVPRWGPMACLKLEALLVLHGESGDSVDGFIAGPDSESRHGSFFAELSERPEERDAYLNKMLVQALDDLLADMFGLPTSHTERGMRRRRRWPNPMLAVMFGLGSLVVVGGIAKTAMIAGKALALSLLALALAVMTGLRGGGAGGGGGNANYEILTGIRRRAGVSGAQVFLDTGLAGPGGADQQPTGLGGLGGLAGQGLAYSGHHTRP